MADSTLERYVVLLGMGRMGRPYARAVHARGAGLAVVDHTPTLRSERTRAVLADGDVVFPVRPAPTEVDWFAAGLAAVGGLPVAAVLPFTEDHVLAAALLSERLGTPGVGTAAAQVARNKALQRAVFADAGIPQPEWAFVHDVAAAKQWAARRYPVVLKPVDRAGSDGVTLVTGDAGVDGWSTVPTVAGFLVEEYVDAPEISAECLVGGGRLHHVALTRKVTTGPPQFVEVGQEVMAGVGDELRRAVADVAGAVVAALGADTCLVHLELFLTAGGPRVIEIAARTPGDHILELHALAGGADLFDGLVAVALGQRPARLAEPSRCAASWFPAVRPGIVVGVEGLEAALAVEHVVDIRVDVVPGDHVGELTCSDDRPVSVVLAADGAEGVERARRQVAQLLRVETVPPHQEAC